MDWGLVMSGGRAAFGAGGWHDRPIEDMLPIEFVQKEEKRDPSTSLVIVIDTSGSMSGVRVQLAKEVARLAMQRLLPHDKVGIVEFYGAKRWAAPLQPASNAIELQRALNRMDAGGGTVILPALEEAFYGLQNVDTRYKHVIVLTDGGVESGDFESLDAANGGRRNQRLDRACWRRLPQRVPGQPGQLGQRSFLQRAESLQLAGDFAQATINHEATVLSTRDAHRARSRRRRLVGRC